MASVLKTGVVNTRLQTWLEAKFKTLEDEQRESRNAYHSLQKQMLERMTALEEREEQRMGQVTAMLQQILNIAMEAKVKAEGALAKSEVEARAKAEAWAKAKAGVEQKVKIEEAKAMAAATANAQAVSQAQIDAKARDLAEEAARIREEEEARLEALSRGRDYSKLTKVSSTFGGPGVSDDDLGTPFGSPAITRDGDIVIADYDNHRIKVHKADGTFVRSFGGKGTGDGQFKYPWAIAVTSTTSLYLFVVSDSDNHRLQVGVWWWEYGGDSSGRLYSYGTSIAFHSCTVLTLYSHRALSASHYPHRTIRIALSAGPHARRFLRAPDRQGAGRGRAGVQVLYSQYYTLLYTIH
jgi:hypothetical protein